MTKEEVKVTVSLSKHLGTELMDLACDLDDPDGDDDLVVTAEGALPPPHP